VLPWYESLQPRLEAGHEIDLLAGGVAYFPALEQALAQARTSVWMETYIFEDDASGRRVAAALAAAAARGVAVHLLVDGFGTPALKGEAGATLARSAVRVETFRPSSRVPVFSRRRLRRMHRKLVVIDGHTAFVGGSNVLDDFYDPNHGKLDAPRYDFAVQVRGPLVARAHLAVQRLWRELRLLHQPIETVAEGAAALDDPVRSDVGSSGRLRAMFVLRDNFRFRRTIERAYLREIAHARRDIVIANAYFLPGARFRRALLHAARRGVRVRLLLQGRAEYRLQYYGSQALYDELLRAGIEIAEYQPSFLHAKVAVIDDWATVGSSNIDPFSLLLAREANVVVVDAGFADALRANLVAAIERDGRPVKLAGHQRRPLPVRAITWFAYGMLRLGVAISGAAGKY
jgi:cardiolipin synthase